MSAQRTCLVLGLILVAPGGALAYGEADDNGVPSIEERLLLVLTNQVRQDPHGWPGWDTRLATSIPRRALAGHTGLFTAARGHADEMATRGFFSHDSADGTPFEVRVARHFAGQSGENLYMAGFGDASAAITAWMGSTTGHRENLLDPTWTHLGTGYASGGRAHFYVQDFGAIRAAEIPRIPAASWRMRQGVLEILATYYDASRAGPRSIEAALGNQCLALERTTGPNGNETRTATAAAPADCTPLVIAAVDADGDRTLYPTTGSLLVGTRCDAEYDLALRPSACGVGDDRPVIEAEASGCACRCSRVAAPAEPFLLLVMLGAAARLVRRSG